MQKVIDRIGTDFYVIPSSIHELLIISAVANMDREELVTMVKEVNQLAVEEHERLSNQVYRYSLENGLKIA
jgi:hypothetical protein